MRNGRRSCVFVNCREPAVEPPLVVDLGGVFGGPWEVLLWGLCREAFGQGLEAIEEGLLGAVVSEVVA